MAQSHFHLGWTYLKLAQDTKAEEHLLAAIGVGVMDVLLWPVARSMRITRCMYILVLPAHGDHLIRPGYADVDANEGKLREVGAHWYPHWFSMPPDAAQIYPCYAKCCELDIPIMMQTMSINPFFISLRIKTVI